MRACHQGSLQGQGMSHHASEEIQNLRLENERLRGQLGAITAAALAVLCEYRSFDRKDARLSEKVQTLADNVPGGFTA
jgi:hypothetical protein